MSYLLITGPTRSYETTRINGDVMTVPSFADLLNAKTAELDSKGIVYTVDWKPSADCQQIVAVITCQDAVKVAKDAPATLSIDQFAKRSGLSRWDVRKLIDTKTIATLPSATRRVHIPIGEYNRYISSR